MYRIIRTSDGVELGAVEKVNYIRIGESGSFAPTNHVNAIGVAYKSKPYNLVGHSDIEGAETVVVSAVDTGDYMTPLTINARTEQGITDLDIANIEAQQMITDLDIKILEV